MERQTVHFEAIDSSRRYFVQCAIISNGKGRFLVVMMMCNVCRDREDGHHFL